MKQPSPVNTVVLSAGLVTVGQWSAGEHLTARHIVGGAFLAIAIAALNGLSPELATGFSMLILVAVGLRWIPPILHKVGIIDTATYNTMVPLGSK